MLYEVIVELKKEVLDPEGRAIKESLKRLGYETLRDVQVSRRFLLELTDDSPQEAEKIAESFLANPVAETYRIRKIDP